MKGRQVTVRCRACQMEIQGIDENEKYMQCPYCSTITKVNQFDMEAWKWWYWFLVIIAVLLSVIK